MSRWLERANAANTPKSQTAGKNKYDPQTASKEGEMERRRVQMSKLKAKAERKKNEKNV